MKKQNLYTTDHIVNKKMPNLISTELFTGEETNLSELVAKERFTILNIWASWCAPCRSEHKHLITLSSNNNSKIVGLNYKDKIENARKVFLLVSGGRNGKVVRSQWCLGLACESGFSSHSASNELDPIRAAEADEDRRTPVKTKHNAQSEVVAQIGISCTTCA